MQTSLSQVVKEAMGAGCKAFCKVLEEATQLLCNEDGKVGNLNILGRLVRLKPVGEALIIGDLHGDLESLIDVLKQSDFLQRLSRTSDTVLIFLGDYGDRGAFSAEVYYTVLSLKLLFPRQVVLLRGNHEGPEDLPVSPHDLPEQFQARFGEEWKGAYMKIRRLFECMYNAALVEERYLLVHGGLPQHIGKIEDLAYAHLHPGQNLLEEILWSDPDGMTEEARASPRGAGKLFGQKVTDRILKKLNAKVLIRSHEPCRDGFKINHDGRVLTVFSRKGSPYFNDYGAYLDIKLSEELKNANQLISYIHQF